MVAAEPTREAAVSSEPDKDSLPLHPTMPEVRVLQSMVKQKVKETKEVRLHRG
jgi:hypothetical protein